MIATDETSRIAVGLRDSLEQIRWGLRETYCDRDDAYPWIVAYSGGKDSTTVLHLVVELLCQLKPEQRKREVHVVSNDTLVESPPVIRHLKASLEEIERHARKKKLPIEVKLTKPYLNDSFWFNLIGKGYPTPNRMFRWCTTRMKIDPTTKYIQDNVDTHGRVYMLLGSRYSESLARKRSIERHSEEGQYFSPHTSLKNCMVANPIAELEDDDVWAFLLQNIAPWGTPKTHRNLITLYRNARGGECPTVLSKEDAPSCGTTSPRFGCWTCTVVEKDRSLAGLIDAGFEEFEPLVDFREWLVSIRDNPRRRLEFSREGRRRLCRDGSKPAPGPFTMSTRKEILKRLLSLQKEVGFELIKDREIEFIKRQWIHDESVISYTRGRG